MHKLIAGITGSTENAARTALLICKDCPAPKSDERVRIAELISVQRGLRDALGAAQQELALLLVGHQDRMRRLTEERAEERRWQTMRRQAMEAGYRQAIQI